MILLLTHLNVNGLSEKLTGEAIGLPPLDLNHGHKIDAVIKMQAPTTLKLLRGFVGMVNYYRDMWPHRRSHILAPLTAKTGTPKKGVKPHAFQWTPDMQKAFDQIRLI